MIDCGETEVLIDAGSRNDSATTICNYIADYVTDGKIEYVIATHGHEDHIAAFYGSNGVFYNYEVENLIYFDYVTAENEPKRTNTNTVLGKFMEAVSYLESKGTNVYKASECYNELNGAKRQYYLDEENTLSINILYNYYYFNQSKDENDHSVITLLTKELSGGNKHYLFTGDLEEGGENKLVEYYSNPSNSKDRAFDILPEVELYKAGHHGSKTSSNEALLEMIKPKYVAVCCCAGSPQYTPTNSKTFPTQDMIDRVGKYTDKIYVTSLATDLPELSGGLEGQFVEQGGYNYTSMNGDIVFYMQNGALKLWCSNNDTILKETDWFKQYRTWNF